MALINLRNALMAGKRLPYDAEVEYLESTGTQWIEVPMVVDSSATVNITGYVGATNKELFSFDKLGTKQFNIETSATFYRWWTSERINVGSGYVGALHSYKCNSSIWVDGVLKGTSTPTDTSTTQTFYILNGYHNAASGRIYHVSVEYGGRLIFDGIPVRKKTVGYLYDRVTGKLFGNAGTGDFVLGQDVVPVEWLEFTGTQRLLTDIPPSVYARDLKTSITYQLTSTASRQLSGSVSSYFEFCSNRGFVQTDASYPADLNRHTLDFIGWVENVNLRVYYDGQSISAAGSIRSDNTSNRFTLGSLKSDSQSNPLKAKVSSLSMEYQDATKFLHWLPVRVGSGSTWEGAMMDVLTRRVYRNAGTGAFAYGNDLKYPIPAS